jgi:Fe-S oxidoreductase
MLDMAKRYLRRVMRILRPQIEAEVPIVVLEPSCASVLRDELHGLFPDDPLAEKLRKQTFLLSEFLEKKAHDAPLPRVEAKALVQGHCHHKSVLKFDDEVSVLKRLGLQFDVPPSGCCGMAGSFGFEREKYDVSVAIGEHNLMPRIRDAGKSTLIIADGFSCREQIAQQSDRQALHLAEVIDMAADRSYQFGECPESTLVANRKRHRRNARLRAAAMIATVCVSAVLLIRRPR